LQSFVVDRTTPKTLRKPVGPEPQREDFPQENFYRDKVIGGTSKLGDLHGFTWIYMDLHGFTWIYLQSTAQQLRPFEEMMHETTIDFFPQQKLGRSHGEV